METTTTTKSHGHSYVTVATTDNDSDGIIRGYAIDDVTTPVITAEMIHPMTTSNMIETDIELVEPNNNTITTTTNTTTNQDVLHNVSLLQNVKWNDTFYDNNPNIIAVFDSDTRKLDELEWYAKLYKAISITVFIVFILLPIVHIIPWDIFAIVFVCCGWIPWCFVASAIETQNKLQQRRCKHIAIGPDGVYVDEVDVPGSQNIMCRNFYPFHTIHKCIVKHQDTSSYPVEYIVYGYDKKNRTLFTIDYMIGTQNFVDIVNSRITPSSSSSEDTPLMELLNKALNMVI